MGKAHGQGAVFRIGDGGGVVRDISASVAGVRGLPGAAAVVDVTSLTQGPALARGEERVRFVVEGDWDDAPGVGSAAVLGEIRTKGASVAFEFGPAGGVAGRSGTRGWRGARGWRWTRRRRGRRGSARSSRSRAWWMLGCLRRRAWRRVPSLSLSQGERGLRCSPRGDLA